MDYNKIGNFIIEKRKEKNLTQSKLAEKLFVSEKTISKWENGKSIPDANSLLKMSEIFDVSINELLNGEKLQGENYTQKAEQQLLELQKQKQHSDKRLLFSEIIIAVVSTILFLIVVYTCVYAIQLNFIVVPVVFICIATLLFLFAMSYCLYLEQTVGYYVCTNCNHKYVPTFKQVLFATHCNRSRRFKCPHCHKRCWHKKVVS